MSACSASSCAVADSTLAIISVAGMYAGVTAKFSPFFSRAISIFLLMSVFGGVKDSLGVGLDLFYYPVGVVCRESGCYTLCIVDYASFFASPLAICVSLIRSVRNLMDASSAILLAPLVGTPKQRGSKCTKHSC